MNDDPDNPPFDFTTARARKPGEPRSSETARLRSALRALVSAVQSGEQETVQAALVTAEEALIDKAEV